jgi:hypothetical protein
MLQAQPYVAKAASQEMDAQNKAAQAKIDAANAPQTSKKSFVDTVKDHLGLIAGVGTVAGLSTQIPTLYNILSTPQGKAPELPPPPDTTALAQKKPVTIPNTPDVYQQGVYPYQVRQAQTQLQNDSAALKADPYNPSLLRAVTNDKSVYDSLNNKMTVDLQNWNKQHPQNDQMVDNYLSKDQTAIKQVTDALNQGALPGSGVDAFMNRLADDNSVANKNPAYAGLRAAVGTLEADGVLSPGDINRALTSNAAKATLANKLNVYYKKIQQVMPNYRTTPDYSSPGANLMNAAVANTSNAISTNSALLNQTLQAAPSAQASPTPDAFQQMLRAKFQPAPYGQQAQ